MTFGQSGSALERYSSDSSTARHVEGNYRLHQGGLSSRTRYITVCSWSGRRGRFDTCGIARIAGILRDSKLSILNIDGGLDSNRLPSIPETVGQLLRHLLDSDTLRPSRKCLHFHLDRVGAFAPCGTHHLSSRKLPVEHDPVSIGRDCYQYGDSATTPSWRAANHLTVLV